MQFRCLYLHEMQSGEVNEYFAFYLPLAMEWGFGFPSLIKWFN